MTAKLYVGNIGRWMTEPQLRALFTPEGDVVQARVVTHDLTGKSCGYGYVEMGSDGEARDAVTRLHRSPVAGLPLIVRPIEEFPNAVGKRRTVVIAQGPRESGQASAPAVAERK